MHGSARADFGLTKIAVLLIDGAVPPEQDGNLGSSCFQEYVT